MSGLFPIGSTNGQYNNRLSSALGQIIPPQIQQQIPQNMNKNFLSVLLANQNNGFAKSVLDSVFGRQTQAPAFAGNQGANSGEQSGAIPLDEYQNAKKYDWERMANDFNASGKKEWYLTPSESARYRIK